MPRAQGTIGGVTVCVHNSLPVQALTADLPDTWRLCSSNYGHTPKTPSFSACAETVWRHVYDVWPYQSRWLPNHISGFSFDPVITDLPNKIVNCRPLATIGSSEHLAVLIKIKLAIVRDERVTRTKWFWDQGNRNAMRATLNNTIWSNVLVGDVATQVRNFTEILLSYQRRFVSSQTY